MTPQYHVTLTSMTFSGSGYLCFEVFIQQIRAHGHQVNQSPQLSHHSIPTPPRSINQSMASVDGRNHGDCPWPGTLSALVSNPVQIRYEDHTVMTTKLIPGIPFRNSASFCCTLKKQILDMNSLSCVSEH